MAKSEAEYRTINREPSSTLHEVLSEIRMSGWVHVEEGYYSHDDFGSAIRFGPRNGWRYARNVRAGKVYSRERWYLYPPAVGRGVDITKSYAGPYGSMEQAKAAAEAFFEGSDWARIIAMGGAAEEPVPTGAYVEFRRPASNDPDGDDEPERCGWCRNLESACGCWDF